MSHVKMVGLCLAAVFAMSAALGLPSASEANQPPVVWHALSVCENVGNGNGSFVSQADCERYTNESPGGTWAWRCVKVTAGTGEFPTQEQCRLNKKYGEAPKEWSVETQARLQLATGQTVLFTGESTEDELKSSLAKITCSASSSTGELNGQQIVKEVVTYTGCKSSGVECNSTGQAKGVIKSESLKGEPVWTKKEQGKPAGVLLSPEAGATKEVIPKIKCSLVESVVFGSIIGELKPEKILTTAGEVIFGENTEKTTERWRQVEEAGVIHELEAEKFESKKFDELKSNERVRFHQHVEIE
ncbi:MAG TPA: hypothetical protein VIG42_03940 [Solirubrobacteraceae bacterium]